MQTRNPKFNHAGSIDCEVEHPVFGWIPFTASPTDAEELGRQIYAAAVAGDFGPIAPFSGPTLAARQAAAWERIKAERDRRKSLGVKFGAHWYHSDADSRIQQLSLFVMGSNVPPVQWKTLTASGAPVFVTMTQSIAAGIFQGTAASDAAVFAAAEAHRVAMEASSTPETYDLSGGWPAGFGDA